KFRLASVRCIPEVRARDFSSYRLHRSRPKATGIFNTLQSRAVD
ncbi:hypothetical protein MRX96_028344, partial [Rhipicephalus microplus]